MVWEKGDQDEYTKGLWIIPLEDLRFMIQEWMWLGEEENMEVECIIIIAMENG